jgi:hypothetical protein
MEPTNGQFNMQILNRLEDKLKPWEQEVAKCLGVVRYTANTWMDNQDQKHLSLNIQWFVVVGA